MPHSKRLNIKIPSKLNKKRLDIALFDLLCKDNTQNLSRSRIKSLITDGFCKETSIGKISKASHKVKEGETYIIEIPPPISDTPAPQNTEVNIIHEDEDILVLNKPAGMVVHPAAGHADGTLVNALLAHCGEGLSGIGGVKRPGIVHRIDKDTSGIMVVAKNDIAHKYLTEQLSSRNLSRIYLAIIWGVPNPSNDIIEKNIGRSASNRKKMAIMEDGGKEAITEYKTLQIIGSGIASLIECKLQTGRTHQIRVHMASEKHWLVGDKIYRPRSFKAVRKGTPELFDKLHKFPRQALHAHRLKLIHPRTKKYMEWQAKIPDDFKNILLACGIDIS